MRIIEIRNLTDSEKNWGVGKTYTANEEYTLPNIALAENYHGSSVFLAALASGEAQIGNGSEWISPVSQQIGWLYGNPTSAPDGKQVVQATPRKIGTYMYFAGSGDSANDPMSYGGSSDDSEALGGHHEVGQDLIRSRYFNINTIDNETHLGGGFIQWAGALNDLLTFEVVPRLTPYVSGSDTNFNLYAGFLIVPAAGNGVVSVDPADMKFVQNVANEFGVRPAGYWNATFNTATKQFENITAAPLGDGEFNLFGEEIVLNRFVNKLQLLGDYGILPVTSHDITQVGQGMQLKITEKTKGTDHEWWWNACTTLYRKKTC